jgi:excisionase family DNA binding protein
MTAYTVANLAAEWQCSEGVIRKAIANGELGCFRLGTLIRIPEEEARRFECRNIPSSGLEGDTPSLSRSAERSADVFASRHRIALPQRLRQGQHGRS